jgi:DNA-binding response OmpR family regulator
MGRVLLVEDDLAIAQLLARALEREGHAVHVAAEGRSALAQVRAGNQDLVVLDLGLPDLDGLEVCRTLRSEDARLPILILTARGSEMDVVVAVAKWENSTRCAFKTSSLMLVRERLG